MAENAESTQVRTTGYTLLDNLSAQGFNTAELELATKEISEQRQARINELVKMIAVSHQDLTEKLRTWREQCKAVENKAKKSLDELAELLDDLIAGKVELSLVSSELTDIRCSMPGLGRPADAPLSVRRVRRSA